MTGETTPDEQTLTAYVALSLASHSAWTTSETREHGPADALAQLPADEVRTLCDTAARLLDRARGKGIRAIVPGDPEWPQQIEDLNSGPVLPNAPLCLWARGPRSLPDALQRSIMITGARAGTPYGTTVTTDLCYHLAAGDRGWTIANLGAYGIDAAALNAAAIAPERVPLLAMLPGGIDRPHPHKHTDMFESIALTGVLVSAYPPGTEPRRPNFAHTLTYLAALTTATIIVEANQSSASVPAARRADAIGRTVMAVPGPVTSEFSIGCHSLIRTGVAHLVASPRDVTSRLIPVAG